MLFNVYNIDMKETLIKFCYKYVSSPIDHIIKLS